MDKRHRKQQKRSNCNSEGEFSELHVQLEPSHQKVSSAEWSFINMSEQEEDLIHRMYRLVGDRWGLIAGRIPGRKAEEIERFWIMRHGDMFAGKREELNGRKPN